MTTHKGELMIIMTRVITQTINGRVVSVIEKFPLPLK